MGASNSCPGLVTSKVTDGGENVRIKYASSSMQGWCKKMEDAHAVVPDLDRTTSFFGVYDGHGGAEVALLCVRQFHIELRSHPNYHNNLNNAIRSVFFRMDELLQQSNEWRELVNLSDNSNWIQFITNRWPFRKETPYVAPQHTGSTACVAVARGNRITVGNVGNSRCVLSRNGQAIELSTDHKPNHRDERRRIQRAGGRVLRDKHVILEVGGEGGQIAKKFGISLIEGVLATSRVIGDFAFKQNKNLPPAEQMVICNPDLRSMEIADDIELLVIASEGIWECMTSQDVVDFVHEELASGETDLRVICERLVDRGLPSGINTTAILVQFKDGTGAPSPTGSDDDEGEGSRGRDVDPEASEEQGVLHDDTIRRALDFVRSKQVVEGGKSS
ncbi:probable protein phosphatase 2C 21 [Phragmites australis]|uniref:probable protein phosphatase 2C 21 n=1 Tax=Phragmites australis TaxID=29695 RepID=UPI002D797758|nr:probable protein phosphatase 2C 21 [Phragmites australis]XP_062222823.1 probable protein phosphatase 2C 21 [Phragmites australis]XP_062222824.1 probable protein phosphatase 2C 21 [Phragmites australis]